jgi:hypothetical protein
MTSMQSYMELFRTSAGLTEAAQGEGSAMALQAALKQHFFKPANKKMELPFDKSADLYKRYQSRAADDGSRGLSRAQWDDRYGDEDASMTVKVESIAVELVDDEPVIKVTFESESSVEDADVTDLKNDIAKIAKGIYPKASVSLNDSGEDYIEFVL